MYTMSLQELADKLTEAWNAFAKYKSNAFGVEYHLSVLRDKDEVGHSFEMLLQAVENYRTAISLKKSKSNHTTLTRFLAKAHDPMFPFWPENFIADFHDGEAWERRDNNEESHEERIERMRKAGYDV